MKAFSEEAQELLKIWNQIFTFHEKPYLLTWIVLQFFCWREILNIFSFIWFLSHSIYYKH